MKLTTIAVTALCGLALLPIAGAETTAAKPKKGFDAFDTDKNGSLNMAELTASMPPGSPEEKVKTRFKRLDTDGNDEISKAEWDAAKKKPEAKPTPAPEPA